MKKLLFVGIASALFVAGILTGTTAVRRSNTYPKAGVVIEIDRGADVVTFTDGFNDWQFYGVEDWMIGDAVAAIMDDNGTENVADDTIVSVRYVG